MRSPRLGDGARVERGECLDEAYGLSALDLRPVHFDRGSLPRVLALVLDHRDQRLRDPASASQRLLTECAKGLYGTERGVFSARPVTDVNQQLRAEYDATLSSVSTRSSTLHFAHAAISLFIGLIGLATAGKLWFDYADEYGTPTMVLGAVATSVVVYAFIRYVLGQKALGFELTAFSKLQRLRGELGFDDPRALLP